MGNVTDTLLAVAGVLGGGSGGGGGGGEAVLVNKTISANGTYLPSADSADGYKKVVVNVPAPTLTTKTITANGTYAAADDNADGYSSVTVNAPTGAQLIASGTFTGNGSDNIDIPLGRKMPQTDFLFRAWVDDGTEFVNDAVYKAAGMFFPMHRPDYFDLSTDGTKTETAGGYVNINNNGTITTVQRRQSTEYFTYVRSGAYSHKIQGNAAYNRLIRSSSGFALNVNLNDTTFKWVSGMTYNWELLYFGNSPETDMVEVA